MLASTSAPPTSTGFEDFCLQRLKDANIKPHYNKYNFPGGMPGAQYGVEPSAPSVQWNNNNALGLTGPYNFSIPQSALPQRVKIEATTPAPLGAPAQHQQSSSLVARNRRFANTNYVRVDPYMNVRVMQRHAMSPQARKHVAAPPPYSATAPSASMMPRPLQPFTSQAATSESALLVAPKPVHGWHIEALQSLSALGHYTLNASQSQSAPAAVKLEEQNADNDVLPSELDANSGLYRAYRHDTGQRHILHNHSIEAKLSAADRAELAAMRSEVSKGLQPKTCRLSGCNHVASCTRYLVKHVHSHLKIRWQCDFCTSSYGARADMVTEHVKKEHPEMLAEFKERRMRRRAPLFESVEGQHVKEE
ncbi:unnamed protein product [Peniophora sp. CBMAI 1063]|nr:unnamed protein product [Peniophora sp. CBMAI 1063]